MIAVIPVGRGRPATLPYVCRGLAVAGVTEIVTIGEKPEGIEPDRHIPSPNDHSPHENVAGHLRKAAAELDRFVWIDDDTFILKPWTPGVYVRAYSIAGMLRLYPNRGGWSQAVRNSIKVMQAWGFDPEEVPCGTIHRPWYVEAKRVNKTLDGLASVGGGSFKALYVAGLADVIPVGDAKVTGRAAPKADADVVSVFHDSWRKAAGEMVRRALPERSRWELEPATQHADNRRGPQRHQHRRR